MVVENYFNYFTEIEEHFLRRRGGGLLLSTLDWALIEMWKDAGVPLEAVLRGIDATFDHYEKRPSRTRKINGLGFCSQEVLAAAEDIKEAAVGSADTQPSSQRSSAAGFEPETIASFLRRSAGLFQRGDLPSAAGISVEPVADSCAATLLKLAQDVESGKAAFRLEDLERHLAVLEEKLFAVLVAAAPDEEIMSVRANAERELTPYRHKMPAAQIEQLQKQYLRKRLFEKYNLPRLSLFYM